MSIASRQLGFSITHELIVDNFAGGGGASIGIERGLNDYVDIAINHDPEAIAMHRANHPNTTHLCDDVFDVNPKEVTGGAPVGLAWFSPDCKHHSVAKGGKPVDKKIRGLAWVAVRWAKQVKPRIVCAENVCEFQNWGALDENDRPCPHRKGNTFRRWIAQFRNLGYKAEWRELRACDYGVPTIRKRFFMIARRDGLPIVWPEPTHGDGLLPYRTAAECIDWSIPCPSIFTRKKPLAVATLKRIANGIRKFVIEADEPFVVPVSHSAEPVAPQSRPITASPTLIQTGYGERKGQAPRVPGLKKPLGTVVAGGSKHALVAAFLAKHYGGNGTPGWPMGSPISTITAKDHHAVVSSHIVKLKGSCKDGHGLHEPLHTVQAGGMHYGEVRAFMLKYYGTATGHSLNEPAHSITSKARLGLITVKGEDYQIVDIGMRMLQPRELFRAQGFDDSYIIDPLYNGKPLTKTAQIRMVGNSVCPPLAEAIVRANYVPEKLRRTG